MPHSVDIFKYPEHFHRIGELTQERLPLTLPFPTKKAAQAYRARLNFFRTACEKCGAPFLFNIRALVFKVKGTNVVIEHRDADPQEAHVTAILAELAPLTPPTATPIASELPPGEASENFIAEWLQQQSGKQS